MLRLRRELLLLLVVLLVNNAWRSRVLLEMLRRRSLLRVVGMMMIVGRDRRSWFLLKTSSGVLCHDLGSGGLRWMAEENNRYDLDTEE
jgi:hypothetical protein